MFLDIEISTLLVVTIAMTLGGLVKGITAFGLPYITIPVLVQVVSFPTAIALTILPILSTNAYQMVHGGYFKVVLARIRPKIIALMVSLFFSVNPLLSAAESALMAVIGERDEYFYSHVDKS